MVTKKVLHMKIPQYIVEKFIRRAKYGAEVAKLDSEILTWCNSQGLTCEECFDDPFKFNTVLLITEPYSVAKEQLTWLKNKIEN